MIRIYLLVLAALIVLSLAGYAVFLWLKYRAQKAMLADVMAEAKEKHEARLTRIKESVDVIARAMISKQCDLSEGVLRLKPLLDVLGHKLSQYPAMWALYNVIESHPILADRKALKRNERMKLDLEREAKEAELETGIINECQQLLVKMKEM